MDVVDEIKNKIDIVDLISNYIKLTKSGKYYKALCPFHTEKSPSFYVFPERQLWHCFGACNTGGDIYTFVMRKEKCDFSQAISILAERCGIDLSSRRRSVSYEASYIDTIFNINELAANYFHELLVNHADAQFARKYIDDRGISQDTIKKFMLGYCRNDNQDLCKYLLSKGFTNDLLVKAGVAILKDDNKINDRFKNRLVFPIYDYNGRVVGFGARSLDGSLPKYINSPQTPVFDKSSCLYGIDKAKDAIRLKDSVIIVEGYMDVLTSHQFGFTNTVASMGTSLTDKHLNIIKRLTHNIVLALDFDVAGTEATSRIADSINIENYMNTDIKVVYLDSGKDPDEIIRNNNTAWSKALNDAVPLIDFVIEVIGKTCDFNSVNGKSEALDKFLPISLKISDAIRRGEYIRKFSKVSNINEEDIREKIRMIKMRNKKRGQTSHTDLHTSFNDGKEYDYCALERDYLSLILQYDELYDIALNVIDKDFEDSKNLEIYTKWIKYRDIEELRNNIDFNLKEYLDTLLAKKFPQFENLNNEQKKSVFLSYLTRAREKKSKYMIMKKAELLKYEADLGGEKAALDKLEKDGISEVMDLKNIYDSRHKRRQGETW